MVVLAGLLDCESLELPVPPPLLSSLLQALRESSAAQVIIKAKNFFIFTAPFPKNRKANFYNLKIHFLFVLCHFDFNTCLIIINKFLKFMRFFDKWRL